MPSREIEIAAPDGGHFMGYLAEPAASNAPGVVVIQEIFGVNQVMHDITDWLAGEGFVALCPDLFWRQEPGVQLTDRTDAEWQRAFQLMQGFDLESGIADLNAAIETVRGLETCNGKVGSIGYCLGGRLAFLSATRTKTDAAVGYYGVALTQHMDEPLHAPLMLHIAGADEYTPADAQALLHTALDGKPNATLLDYPGRDHAFARIGGKHYDAKAANTANARSLDFLHQHLG